MNCFEQMVGLGFHCFLQRDSLLREEPFREMKIIFQSGRVARSALRRIPFGFSSLFFFPQDYFAWSRTSSNSSSPVLMSVTVTRRM